MSLLAPWLILPLASTLSMIPWVFLYLSHFNLFLFFTYLGLFLYPFYRVLNKRQREQEANSLKPKGGWFVRKDRGSKPDKLQPD